MNKKTPIDPDELEAFREAVSGTRQIKQDTIMPKPRTVKTKRAQPQIELNQAHAEHPFSDQFEPHFEDDGPTRYTREDVSRFELKKLRRGDYVPELFLDLHGLTQEQAKQELAALLRACVKEHFNCACISHGIGKHILKRKVPHWLCQHPDVMAFHQAPWSGEAMVPCWY